MGRFGGRAQATGARWQGFAVAGDGLHGLETTVNDSRDFPKGWVTKESGLWPDS